MTRIGVTGHMNLPPATQELIRQGLREFLTGYDPTDLTGISCLAAGADSLFAECVLELGGSLEVVLPSGNYREQKVAPEQLPLFDELLRSAVHVHVMPFADAGREAYEAASATLLDSSDVLVAVWDGLAPVDRAGTAAVVELAQAQGLPVHIIWPHGAQRASRPA